MIKHPTLLRGRGAHQHNKVSFIELFFDLVFVFAITQLSHALIADFSPQGALRALMLMLAVWWVWIFTTWVTNWLDPDRSPVRVAMMALSLAGLVLAASIPQAFAERAPVFACTYVALQVGRSLFFLWAVRGHPGMVRNFQRILAWLMAGAVCWLAGAWTDEQTRPIWWAAALVIEYLSPSLGFHVPGLGRSATTDWDVDGAHLSERCGLFIIIALGESVLVTGATFAGMDWTPEAITAMVASFVGSLAMWWLYFDATADIASHQIEHANDPGRLARLGYTYLHLFFVAGIIVSAVADEFVLHHPMGHTAPATAVAVIGGTLAYLMGGLLFRRVVMGHWSGACVLGMAVLVALGLTAEHWPPLALATGSSVVLVAIAVWEARNRARCLPTSATGH